MIHSTTLEAVHSLLCIAAARSQMQWTIAMSAEFRLWTLPGIVVLLSAVVTHVWACAIISNMSNPLTVGANHWTGTFPCHMAQSSTVEALNLIHQNGK
jgi:hypothetical protein